MSTTDLRAILDAVEDDELLFRAERHHDPHDPGYDEGWDACLAAIRCRVERHEVPVEVADTRSKP